MISKNRINVFCRICTAVALVIVWSSGVCQGQVRVRQGIARDASSRVGSGGRNTGVIQRPGVLGNQIVSGNIGGGQSFRGIGGIGDVTRFGGTSVGSSSLSGFRRDSYGLDYSASKLGVAQPFYLPSSTVLGVRGITSGLARPGSNMPSSVNVNPIPIRGIDPERSQVGKVPGSSNLGPVDRRMDLARPNQAVQAAADGSVIETASNLFGIRRTNPQLNFDRPYEAVVDDLPDRKTQQRTRRTVEPRTTETFQALPEWARPVGLQDELIPPPGADIQKPNTDRERPMDEAVEDNVTQSKELIEQSKGASSVPSLADVYEQIRAKKQAQEQQDAAIAKSPGELITPMAPTLPQDQEQAAERLARHMRIYNTFVSSKRSSFNEYMALGEQLLKQGNYYQAARAYQGAIGQSPDNPLGYLGRAYSLAGAGDLLSASDNLFPEQAQTKIDLKEFFKSPEEIDRITTKLSALMEIKPEDARIRLLLGYIYYYSGNAGEAETVLQEAAELAKADPQMPPDLGRAVTNFAQAVSRHRSSR